MRLARTIAFWLLLAALVVANVMVIQHSLTARLWEDEAFNLTVPLNLLDGLGYSSDGALSGSRITPFDARISTGPTVLLPVAGVLLFGADPVISARLVPVVFWMLLIAGLAVLGGRLGGRWVALAGAAVPLAFNGLSTVSPIQGPADLLGEIPAAALIVWALVALRRRPWLAGLLVGLAVQAKLIALLALPAFAVAVWVRAPGRGWRRIGQTFRRGWLPLVLAGVPTLLYELAVLATLGMTRYIDHLHEMVYFVRSGGQSTEPTTVAQKLDTLASTWFVPAWVAWITAAIVVVLTVGGIVEVRRRGRLKRQALMLALAAGTGALTFIAWWSTASHTPLWVRHPAAGVLAFFPVLVIVAVWGARVLASPRPVHGAVLAATDLAGAQMAASGAPKPRVATPEGDARSAPDLAGSQMVASGAPNRRVATPEQRGQAPGASVTPDAHGRARRIAATTLAGALAVSLAWSISGHVAQTLEPREVTLAVQRADVAPIAEWVEQNGVEWLAARPWGGAIAPIVMSGAHVGLYDAPRMQSELQLTLRDCPTDVLLESGRYRICAPAAP